MSTRWFNVGARVVETQLLAGGRARLIRLEKPRGWDRCAGKEHLDRVMPEPILGSLAAQDAVAEIVVFADDVGVRGGGLRGA
jgi:hypothetical protein